MVAIRIITTGRGVHQPKTADPLQPSASFRNEGVAPTPRWNARLHPCRGRTNDDRRRIALVDHLAKRPGCGQVDGVEPTSIQTRRRQVKDNGARPRPSTALIDGSQYMNSAPRWLLSSMITIVQLASAVSIWGIRWGQKARRSRCQSRV